MAACADRLAKFWKNISRKKGISEDLQRKDLVKGLRLYDLTFLSIGSMIGSGLYVLTGTIVRNIAGPATVLSYVLAAFASALSALGYAELAARVPVAGSAYQFTYISIGEIWAFLIGWNVALEHAVSAAAIARAWSGYLDALFGHPIRSYLIQHVPMQGGLVAKYPDFLAVGLVLIVTAIVASGVKSSSKSNLFFAIINLTVIVFIICTGIYLADLKNWTHVRGGFFPMGASGTISGAATLIFSYVGYEVVASATEEAINPQRDVPLSLLLSILLTVVAYVCASSVLTLMVPWYTVSIYSPFPNAYRARGWVWAEYVISVGALAAMSAAMISMMMVVPRYIFSMARDGILMQFFYAVNERTGVPVVATVVSGIFASILAAIFSLTTLVEFISIGQLLACTFVSICVIKLRYGPNQISKYEREVAGLPEGGLVPPESDFANGEEMPLQPSSSSKIPNHGSITHPGQEAVVAGTLKKSVAFSSCGFLFNWTQRYQPGEIPFYSLLIAIITSTGTTAMLLFDGRSIGQPWFYLLLTVLILITVVCLGFITLFTQDEEMQTFKVPLVPLIPFLSIVINITLILKLQLVTWIRFAVWVGVGLIIYFAYGYRHSKAKE